MTKGSTTTGRDDDRRLREEVLAYYSMRADRVGDDSHQDLVRAFGPAFSDMVERLVEEGLITSASRFGQLTDKGWDCARRIVEQREGQSDKSVFEPGHVAYVLRLAFLFEQIDVFRTIKVPIDVTFEDLNSMIQATLGWSNTLSYEFVYADDEPNIHYLLIPPEESIEHLVRMGRYELDPMPEGQDWRNAADVCLFAIMPLMHRMVYIYNFDVDWQISIELLGTDVLEDGRVVCIDGGGALFPEELAGEEAYYDFLDARNDPSGTRQANAVLGDADDGYRPFDLAETNERLSVWATYGARYCPTSANIRLRVDNGKYVKMFVRELSMSKLSLQTIEAHTANIEDFLCDYLPKVRGLTMAEGIKVVPEYLESYVLDVDSGLPSLTTFKTKIVSIKRFYALMSFLGYVRYADEGAMLDIIKERQGEWLDFIRKNRR